MNQVRQEIDRQFSRGTNERIFVRVASQVSLSIRGDNIFRVVQERILKWVFSRNVRRPPDGAWAGHSFEIDADNSERVSAIALEEPKYWALRLSERLKDPGRIWSTEVGIAQVSKTEIIFGCRLLCTEAGTPVVTPRSIPSFVRGIVFTQKTFLDGREQGADPWIVNDETSVSELVELLLSPVRKHPVVIFSTPEATDNVDDAAIPVRNFIRRTAGYVHSVVITPQAAYRLTEELGKEFSVYRQAIRTYYPNFNPDEDLSTDHPVATAARVASWSVDEGDESFEDFLVQQTLRLTRPRFELEKDHPPFQQIKLLAATQARQTASQPEAVDADLLALAEEEVATAKQEVEDYLGLITEAENERERALSKARELEASYSVLQAHVRDLRDRLKVSRTDKKSLPKDLTDLGKWAQENLTGSIVLHERAVKAASNSKFEEPEFIYQTLILMRDYYVPMRTEGGADLKKAYDTELAKLGLEDTKCFSQKNRAKKFGGEYFVKYQGDKRELDWHLKGKNSRDERYAFRLYYFWDKETNRVVVGYLPGHLRNQAT